MERAIQIYAAIHLTAIGLSHIFAHRAWADLFIGLRARGKAGVLFVGMLSLSFGSILAAFHSAWSGIPLLVTLLGWSQVIKGTLYLTVPAFGLRQLERVSTENSRMFAVPGVAFLVLAAVLVYHLVGR